MLCFEYDIGTILYVSQRRDDRFCVEVPLTNQNELLSLVTKVHFGIVTRSVLFDVLGGLLERLLVYLFAGLNSQVPLENGQSPTSKHHLEQPNSSPHSVA